MKRWLRRILVTAALIFVASYVSGSVDYWRIKNGNRPCFVLNWDGFFDGGTYVGLGFGYDIIANNGVKYAMEHTKSRKDWYVTKGPELKFWLVPFLNKSELKFQPLNPHS